MNNEKEELRKEWLVVEHDIRFIASQEEDFSIGDWLNIDDLKNSIIALMGFKLFGDNNEVFYTNMKIEVERSIKYLIKKFPTSKRSFKHIEEFIKKYL